MAFSASVWGQLKNKTADELIAALERDGWKLEPDCKGAIQVYRHADTRRVGIHYHPKKTFGAGLLKGLLSDIGWDEQDLKRLKLIK
jgi:predicted RNA binding protein YcfA (HicA-like mRNA interferase family)